MDRISLLLCASCALSSAVPALAQATLVEVKSQYSGKCLTIKGGSKEHGAGLMHNQCGTGDPSSSWEMRPEGGGYRIVNRNSELCLGVAHASKKDGARIKQVGPCSRADALWKIDPPGLTPKDFQKPLIVRNHHSNKCLALVKGDVIKQYGCSASQVGSRPKIAWQFLKVDTPQRFKRVFVTSKTYPSNFGGVSGADRICNEVAQKQNLPGKYRAWLSEFDHRRCEGMRTRFVDGGMVLNTSIPYVNVCSSHEVKVADSFEDLTDGSLQRPIRCTEEGKPFAGTPGVWTGTRKDGRAAHYDACKKGKWKTETCYIQDFCWNYQVIGSWSRGVRCLSDWDTVFQEDRDRYLCDYAEDYPDEDYPAGKCRKPIAPQHFHGICCKKRWKYSFPTKGFTNPDVRSLIGKADATDKNWTQYRWLSCRRVHAFRLYCFQR